MDQVNLVLDDESADLSSRLRNTNWRRDFERCDDMRRASALQLTHEVAARRNNPYLVAATLELAGEADHDAFQPAHAHGLRGEQNPHRQGRL